MEDAECRLHRIFHGDIIEQLPPSELGSNPFRSYHAQISTTFRRAADLWLTRNPTSATRGLKAIGHDRRWAVMAQVELLTRALGEAFCRVDVRGDELHWEAVPASKVFDVVRDPARPEQVSGLKYMVRRAHPVSGVVRWVVDHWDVSDRGAPVFAVLLPVKVDETTKLVDATAEWMPESKDWEQGYPYWWDGAPILPWVLYHARLGHPETFAPFEGSELVNGTLTTSVLMTYWLEGMRDGTFPVRGVVDGTIVHGTVQPKGGQQQQVVSRVSVVKIRSDSQGRQAVVASWPKTMDPDTYFGAVQSYVQMLALQAGMSAQDVAVTSAGMSRVAGVAIQVSRAGIERARQAIKPSLMQSDERMSEVCAAMWNAYVRTPGAAALLPTAANSYTVQYAIDPLTPDEIRTRTDSAVAQMAAGIMSRVTAMAYVHPEWTPARIAHETKLIDDEGESDVRPEGTTGGPDAATSTDPGADPAGAEASSGARAA